MTQLSLFQPLTWAVSDLTRYLRALLENDDTLQDLWVNGEVSNLSRPTSGHLYFTLKDNQASLRCVMWRNAVMRQPFLPRDGDAVEAHGYISIYEVGGQYQLYADWIRPAGEGALYQEFLRLKARLEAEGLFDPTRKRTIPPWPNVIGIVTSPTAAALRDILNTLARRFPLGSVVLAPTPVQGEEAPSGIVTALETLNRIIHPDVILLARGGGSIEDLMAFNDERVARAIVASAAPVICGVGHETDFTIADFAADLRAPTPTAAAELATPDQAELRASLSIHDQSLQRSIRLSLDDSRRDINLMSNRLSLLSPLNRIRSGRQHLDDLARRLQATLSFRLQMEHARLASLNLQLKALNPQAILGRGYALVTQVDGLPVRSVQAVHPGDDLNVRVSDGVIGVRVRHDSHE